MPRSGRSCSHHPPTFIAIFALGGMTWCFGAPAWAAQPPAAQPLRGVPTPPTTASRPANWPGGQAPPAEMQTLETSTIVARIGADVVLVSDVAGPVREMMAVNVDKIPREQVRDVAGDLLKKAVGEAVERKLVYLDARRKIPEENLPKVEEELGGEFEKSEVRRMLRQTGARNRADLETLLRQRGTNIEHEKQTFIERQLAGYIISEKAKDEREVTHQQLVDWYQAHQDKFEIKAKARWEQLTVKLPPSGSEASARNKLAWMGNQVMAGTPWADVARVNSEGASATSGGDRGWVTAGALKSKVLDTAIFSLPVGALSPILSDEQGLHIVRVVERREAGRVSFAEAQTEIRKEIKEQRRREKFETYVADLRENTKVWTIFDEPADAERLVAFLAAPIEAYQDRVARKP